MLTFSFISKGSSSVYKSINSITIGEGANLSLLLRMHLYLGEIIVRIYAKLYSMIRIRVFLLLIHWGMCIGNEIQKVNFVRAFY